MKIYLHNQSTLITDAEVQAMMPAFKKYLGLVASKWGAWGGATLVFGAPPTNNEWQILLLDNSTQAGALGFHDFTPGGKPIAKVFVGDDQKYGFSVPVTILHELGEMIADPYIVATWATSQTRAYALEIGDPVEADALGFTITVPGYAPVLCSDFVLPAWFIPGSPGPYDWAGHCTRPLQILKGGYAQYQDVAGWHSINAEGVIGKAEDSRANRWRGSRAARYS